MDIDLTGRTTQVITCSKCNCQFLFRPSEQTYRNGKPSLCPNCYRKKRDEQKKKKEKLDAEKRKREKELERIQFDERLKSWQVVALDDIHLENDNVLYILGNGFDIMRFEDNYSWAHPKECANFRSRCRIEAPLRRK